MRNTKSAFTLVELIVVITILAILGTIAFISLQGYSAEARNSKRIQDLSSISSSLNIKLTRGMSVLSAIADSSNAATSIALGGAAAQAVASDKYNAGSVNYTALEMKASEFQDPNGDNYVMGATTLAGGPFQLAASVESDGGEVAKVSWSFNPRVAANTYSGVIDSTGLKFTLDDLASTGNFKVGDTVSAGTTVKSVSSDWMTINLQGTTLTPGAATLGIAANESTSLISIDNAWGAFVTDGSTTNLPY